MNRRACYIAACLAALACLALGLACHDALAQSARKPFSVGGPEGAADSSSLTLWILSWQASFKLQLTEAMKQAKANGAALWGLAALSFGYGVFHAAGPGHGKAVIAAYMVANEQALKRGLALSFLAWSILTRSPRFRPELVQRSRRSGLGSYHRCR